MAHRLSTIRNADVIYVLDGGKLVEFGNHEELMRRREAYYRLVMAQQLGDIDKEDQKKALSKATKFRNILIYYRVFIFKLFSIISAYEIERRHGYFGRQERDRGY